MLVKKNESFRIVSEKPRGGVGTIINNRYLDSHDLNNGIQGLYINDLEVGSEIGYHIHEGDEEVYYILEGKGLVNDNGVEKEAASGDFIYTKSGEGHSLKNTGDKPLKFMAFIIKL